MTLFELLTRATGAGLVTADLALVANEGTGTVILGGGIAALAAHRRSVGMAKLHLLLPAPLPLEPTEGGLAAVVTVTEDPVSNGQFWTRQYNRARGFPQVIHSTKAFAGPTGLEEYVTHWLGMSLTLEAEANCLSFRGDRYFLKLMGRRVFLPGWLSPGRLTVSHHDLGAGLFVFTLTLEHRALGCLLDQRAVFSDVRDT